jgi:DNA segregation ATPase FtsK/SpoIIIE-like protein
MVMEYVEGETLERAFRSGRVSGEAAFLAVLLPLLDGIERVHEAGFIHRDIKPENIYLRRDGTPVLLDFGSARQAIGAQTRTLTALVTPGYAPFEQYGGGTKDGRDKQGPWTDIYALGATFYRGIAGRGPADAMQRANAVVGGQPDILVPAVRVGEGQYSRPFLEAIDRALEFLPEKRPQSVAAWRAMFSYAKDVDREAATEELPTATAPRSWPRAPESRSAPLRTPAAVPPPLVSPPPSGAEPRPAGHRAVAWAVAAALGGLLIGAGALWVWSRLPGGAEREPVALIGEQAGAGSLPAEGGVGSAEEETKHIETQRAKLAELERAMKEEQERLANLQRQTEEAEKKKDLEEAARLAALEDEAKAQEFADQQARLAELRAQVEAEEARLAALEAERREAQRQGEAEQARVAEEVKKVEDEARRMAMEAQRELEETQRKAEEEARLAAEAEAQRKAEEEARLAAEAEAQRKAEEEARLAAEAEAQGKAEEEARLAAEAEAQRKAEEEARIAAAAEAARQTDPAKERDVQIGALLAAAAEDVEAVRLTSPAGRNALDRYREVLALDPGNEQAAQGLVDIADKYVELAEKAAAVGAYDRALGYIDKAEAVAPGVERVASARKTIAAAKAAAVASEETVVSSAPSAPAAPAASTAPAPAASAAPAAPVPAASVASAAPVPAATPSPDSVSLTIDAGMQGVAIYVDNKMVGTTSPITLELAPGRHKLRVEKSRSRKSSISRPGRRRR